MNISFKDGKFDGMNSATMQNPIHKNWEKNKDGKLLHFNKEYLRGYMQGFEAKAGYRPLCFPS